MVPIARRLALAPLAALALAALGAAQTAPFAVLDNVEGPFVDLNLFPVRPMVALGGDVWAVNTHASTVERLSGAGGPAAEVVRVPWGPVAIAVWTNPATTQPELVVACRGSWVLARVDPASGTVLAVVPLPPEPGDLLVDQGADRAWVACSGRDEVAQVDLPTGTVTTWSRTTHPDFRVKHPLYLTFDAAGKVLVPSHLSGNDSTAARIQLRRASAVLDLKDPAIAVQGLPDEDLFRIDPDAGTVTPVLLEAGAVLFGLAVNPVTGRVWILNTEANNAGPENAGEAAVRGRVVVNRLAITRPVPFDPPPKPLEEIDLDDTDRATPGQQIDPTRTVGQPNHVVFTSDGHGWISGLLTDNVTELDELGGWQGELDLPDGSVPRGLLADEANDRLYVHCWGTNEVRAYALSSHAFLFAHPLTPDPTPADVAEGRRLFYDASHSRDNNASCASCHVEGDVDHLVWNLEQTVRDGKGPLLTQTMKGLARSAPFHWRGERKGLADFNPAFDALLGGTPLDRSPGGEFEAFERFVMGLAFPANAWENRERVVDSSIVAPGIDPGAQAVIGQTAFFEESIVGGRHCNDCHTMPIGTNHDIFGGEPTEVRPKRAHFKNRPFPELYRRLMEVVQIETYVDPADPGQGTTLDNRGLLGTAATHAGLIESFPVRVTDFGMPPALTDSVVSFLVQLDQGLAPAVHQAVLLDAAHLATAQPELETYLMPQATARNCDVVAFGTADVGGTPTPVAWAWDRQSGLFVPDPAALPARTLADFVAAVATESTVFCGLPVGMGRRFAIDRDLDGLADSVDPAPGVPFVDPLDTTAPAFTVAPTVVWHTTKTARLAFETDEPTVWHVVYQTTTGEALCVPRSEGCTETSKDYARAHTVLLTDLLPSTAASAMFAARTWDYTVSVEVRDRAGNVAVYDVPGGVTSLPYGPGEEGEVVVGDLAWTTFEDGLAPGRLVAKAVARVDFKRGGPPALPAPNHLVVARVLVDGAVATAVEPLGRTSLADRIRTTSPGSMKDLDLDGPFLVSQETDGIGATTLFFALDGVPDGARVTLNLESVITLDATQLGVLHANLAAATDCSAGGTPTGDCDGDGTDECCLEVPVPFAGRSLVRWSLPDTAPEHRALDEVFDPRRPTRFAPPLPR